MIIIIIIIVVIVTISNASRFDDASQFFPPTRRARMRQPTRAASSNMTVRHGQARFQTPTPGLHNKTSAYNIFARGWVAQKSICS